MYELANLEQIKQPSLFTQDQAEKFIADIKVRALGTVYDMSTKKGQDECRSDAAKVASSKTAIERFKLECTEGLRLKTAEINQWGKFINSGLQEIQDTVRKPLTEFEAKEKARVSEREQRIAQINAFYNIAIHSATDAKKYLHEITTLEQFDWNEDFELQAKEIAERAKKYLEERLAVELQREADAAEMARLKEIVAAQEAAAAQAKQKEREDAMKSEAAEAARLQAEKIAADQIRKIEEEKIAAEKRAKAAEEAKENQRLEALEAAKRAEQKRKDDVAAAEERERQRQQAEKEKEAVALLRREESARNRAKIENQSFAALYEIIFGEMTDDKENDPSAKLAKKQAKAVIDAIAKGEIPNLQINY